MTLIERIRADFVDDLRRTFLDNAEPGMRLSMWFDTERLEDVMEVTWRGATTRDTVTAGEVEEQQSEAALIDLYRDRLVLIMHHAKGGPLA